MAVAARNDYPLLCKFSTQPVLRHAVHIPAYRAATAGRLNKTEQLTSAVQRLADSVVGRNWSCRKWSAISRTDTHTQTQTHTRTDTHTHTQTRAHTHTQTRAHTHTHRRARTHTHTRARARHLCVL